MDLSHDTEGFLDTTRRDGWTPELKARFLAILAESGNARLAARRCGMSAQSAYVQRRRDAHFARTWAAAMRLARDHCEQVLGDRAIEGVEEPIWYRGELVGTRRRYDTRLLLAHMARLDRLASDERAEADAGRFDEMLALIAGEELPEALDDGTDFLPDTLREHAGAAAKAAERAIDLESPPADPEAAEAERAAMRFEAGCHAWDQAILEWEAWRDRAHATVDRVLGDFVPQDRVNLSTSELGQANPPAAGQGESDMRPTILCRHPELVCAAHVFDSRVHSSGSPRLAGQAQWSRLRLSGDAKREARWMLKRVQHDDVGEGWPISNFPPQGRIRC